MVEKRFTLKLLLLFLVRDLRAPTGLSCPGHPHLGPPSMGPGTVAPSPGLSYVTGIPVPISVVL